MDKVDHDVDHVHVMFRAQPKSELSKFINAYKSASSRLLKTSSVSKTVDIPTFKCYNSIDYSYIKNNNKYIF